MLHGITVLEIVLFELVEVAKSSVSRAWVMFLVLTALAQDALFNPWDSLVIGVVSRELSLVLYVRMDFV